MTYLEEDISRISAQIHDLGLEGSKILVTGSTGLIGSLCVKACLANGNVDVIGMARNPQKAKELFGKASISFVYQDISEPIP